MGFVWLFHPEQFMDNLSRIPEGDKRGKGRPKTTWPYQKWGFWEFLAASDIAPADAYTPKPKGYRRSETIPEHSVLLENGFIIANAAPPLLLHALSYHIFPNWKWGIGFAFIWYHFWFIRFAARMIKRMHHWMEYYGTFDEENRSRDLPPDTKVKRLAFAIYIYLVLRVLMPLFMAYDKNEYPLDGLSIWTLPKIAAWVLTLDYFFYCYHRSCHEVPALWFIHRAHHQTKHPTPLLSILADDIQEGLEIFLIPFLSTLVVPLNWPEAWASMCLMLYVEAMGHSGIRAYMGHPLLGVPLRWLNMDLCVEDHDLHHRNGRSGKSYCKATRVWDTIFDTCGDRVETLSSSQKKAGALGEGVA